MSDDLELDLKAAFRAVKDSYDGSSPNGDLTLQRALFASRKSTRRRKVTQWVLVPIAAALFASTAWAGVTGRLTPMVDSVREVFHAEAASPPAPARAPSAGLVPPPSSIATAPTSEPLAEASSEPPPASEPAPGPEPASAPEPPTTTTTPPPRADEPVARAVVSEAPVARAAAPPGRRPAPPPAPRTEPTAAAPPFERVPSGSSRSTSGSAPVDDREAQLFAEAHRLHFVARDPARALVAWDRYLAAAPNGSLAPEARYNRALALVRLGRTVEARTELEVFASGSYRRDEARALLVALARDGGAP